MAVDLTGRPGPSYARIALGLLSRRRGTSLPDRTVIRRAAVIDREHLARYDRVCGFRLADALPATYPHVLAAPLAMRLMSTPDFPFPLAGLVHVANRITVRRPIDAGSRLDLSVRAAGLRPHDRGQQFDVISSAAVDGEEAWRGVSTYLRKDRPGAARGDRPPGPAATARWRVPVRVGRDYAAVSGDHNPIHTSRLGAYLFGFSRPIAHGMWSKAHCLAALNGRLPAAYRVDVAFKLPVLLPATVSFAAARATDGWAFTLHAAGSGRPHLAGSVTGVTPRPGT
ncbi:MaoC/PaaZ C-terminal domain-containing protein [Actinoplanes sp. NPDC049599]|uniref:MaoC/PaaZ C-terminal domain-containing protein n=1 Tax=Actinoplanes sp. NPDC049599 TaxID=3363903 RepID=UPI00378C1BA3